MELRIDFEYLPWEMSPDHTRRDQKQWWDWNYRKYYDRELRDWYENNARFPEVLCPEYNVKFWRTIGYWWYRLRYNIVWNILGKERKKDRFNVLFWCLSFVVSDKWFDRWYTPEWEECLFCGFRYNFIECFDSDWYRFKGGGSYFNGDVTIHYFEGEWTCPRCLRQWEYGDSD